MKVHKSKHRLRTISDLIRHLSINESFLREVLDELNTNEGSLYRSWNEPKRSGGTRPIDAPRDKLKFIQKRINDTILQATRIHRAALGGVRGKHLRDNLMLHVGKPMVVNFDLEQFFLNITAEQVLRTFRCIGIAPDPANVLTRLTTFKGRLPQGAPTSTMLANLVVGYGPGCLDDRIESLCRKHKARYGRWIDDMSISGPRYLPKLGGTVEKITDETGVKLNRKKTEFASDNGSQIVTRHRVNHKPNTPKEDRRQLKAMLHKYKTKGPAAFPDKTSDELRNHLQGKINHLQSINPTLGAKYLEDFNSMDWQ